MTDIKVVISGLSEYLKAKLYPSIDAFSRAKISAALFAAACEPKAALMVLMCTLLPKVPVEKVLETAATFGVMDGSMNVDTGRALGVARAYIEEIGEYTVNLFGVEFSLTAANIDDLGEYLR